MDANLDEDSHVHDGDARWPFHTFAEQLILDMFDPGILMLLLYFIIY